MAEDTEPGRGPSKDDGTCMRACSRHIARGEMGIGNFSSVLNCTVSKANFFFLFWKRWERPPVKFFIAVSPSPFVLVTIVTRTENVGKGPFIGISSFCFETLYIQRIAPGLSI